MLEYITANYVNIFAIVGAVVTCASVIVKITPSTRDDAMLAKIVKLLDWVSVVTRKPTV